MAEKDYDELVQDVQDGEITQVDFINLQPELAEEYHAWLKENALAENGQSADAFMTYRDNMAMNTQIIGKDFKII